MTPTAKKSTEVVWFWRHMTSGAMYPGVPDVSYAFSSRQTRAIPKSVMRTYPIVKSEGNHVTDSLGLLLKVWCKLTIGLNYEVLRLYISMNNILFMEVLEARH